ncbi:MAG: hypothetical protein H7836_04735 [Magnetococcus sp. YQC-3]
METKICTKCKIEKDKSEFSKNSRSKDGLFHNCKSCQHDYYIRNKPIKPIIDESAIEKKTTKTCFKCKIEKELTEFCKSKKSKDGHYYYCNDCRKEYYRKNEIKFRKKTRDYYNNNKETILSQSSNRLKTDEEYRKRRLGIMKKYRINNPEKVKISTSTWSKNNPDKIAEKNLRRWHIESKASVKWADTKKIKEIYLEAKRLESEDGIKRHVDHIIPLQGKNVCGLHVENNLQILTATENFRKNNSFDNE